jgi:hypothetical protein
MSTPYRASLFRASPRITPPKKAHHPEAPEMEAENGTKPAQEAGSGEAARGVMRDAGPYARASAHRAHRFSAHHPASPASGEGDSVALALAVLARESTSPAAPCLTGGKVLSFPTRLTGTPHRLYLTRDHTTDAVKSGEPCPTCQCTSWRLTPPGLWIDDRGHYWSPRRQVEKSTSDPAPAPGIETGRPS